MITTDLLVNTAITASVNGAFNAITVYFVYHFFLKNFEKKKEVKKRFKPRNY